MDECLINYTAYFQFYVTGTTAIYTFCAAFLWIKVWKYKIKRNAKLIKFFSNEWFYKTLFEVKTPYLVYQSVGYVSTLRKTIHFIVQAVCILYFFDDPVRLPSVRPLYSVWSISGHCGGCGSPSDPALISRRVCPFVLRGRSTWHNNVLPFISCFTFIRYYKPFLFSSYDLANCGSL